MDTIITQARERSLRLVLLWFATWKNGSNHYMPEWMKLQPAKYPNMIGKDGQPIDSPSPHAEATLEADIRAFSAFMRHLREFDTQHTVIMVQVQNEPGSWDTVRDYSPLAQELFDGPVPVEALAAMNKPASPNRNWTEVFGRDADEFFQVWHVARFIGKVAAAGKAIHPLDRLAEIRQEQDIKRPGIAGYRGKGSGFGTPLQPLPFGAGVGGQLAIYSR